MIVEPESFTRMAPRKQAQAGVGVAGHPPDHPIPGPSLFILSCRYYDAVAFSRSFILCHYWQSDFIIIRLRRQRVGRLTRAEGETIPAFKIYYAIQINKRHDVPIERLAPILY